MKAIARLSVLLVLLFGVGALSAQEKSTLKGYVRDIENDVPIPFASVQLKQGDSVIAETKTDIEGSYMMVVPFGSYTMAVSNFSYKRSERTITVENKRKWQYVYLKSQVCWSEIDPVPQRRPLINIGDASTERTFDQADIQHFPY